MQLRNYRKFNYEVIKMQTGCFGYLAVIFTMIISVTAVFVSSKKKKLIMR